MSTEILMLGGRPFGAATETTFEQDNHVMALVYDTRLHEVIEAGGDVIGAVLRSGRVTEFLAGVLVEMDTEWSPARAAENERFFAGLRAPADKAALSGVLQSVLVGFFGAAGTRSPASPSSSSPNVPASDVAPPVASSTIPRTRSRRRRRLDGAPGTASSTPSPTTSASAPAP